MVFSSPSFLFIFLPLFFAAYYPSAPGWRNAIIFAGSVLFYFVGASHVALVLVLSVPINQYVGLYIHRYNGSRRAAAALVLGILVNLAPLLLYKYAGFLARSMNDGLTLVGLGARLPVPQLLLPAGISFFTFQGLSYLVDIYWRKIKPAPTVTDFGMYHTSFPQLIAGPIVRYVEIADRVVHRPLRLEGIEWGIVRFCFGLAKKIVLADNMGAIADRIFALPADQLHRAARMARYDHLHAADLFRLLRLFRHGDRPRGHARVPLPGEFRSTLFIAKRHGVLAPLAHDAVALVS